ACSRSRPSGTGRRRRSPGCNEPVMWRHALRRLGLNRRDDIGSRGERAAERHLRRSGYAPLGRNVRVPIGEVDLVFEAPDGRTIVLVEVKARVVRSGDADRTPERAITGFKARKLVSLAHALRRKHGWHDRPLRIDVVAVEFEEGRERPAAIRHHQNAIDATGRRI
ncbi:MAG: YraN family protein, partial [Phycisphaerales bacterium]|nr:YraN family protein [Phycisphaerales bacterium]